MVMLAEQTRQKQPAQAPSFCSVRNEADVQLLNKLIWQCREFYQNVKLCRASALCAFIRRRKVT